MRFIIAFILGSLLSGFATGGQEPDVWRVGPNPLLRIGSGGEASEETLFRVKDATRLPDGSVAVAQSGEVVLFGEDGHFRRFLGRKGEGPGEFGAPRSITRSQEEGTLRIYDSLNRRVTSLTIDGELVRTEPFPPPTWTPFGDFWVAPDGSLLTRFLSSQSFRRFRSTRADQIRGAHVDTVTVLRFAKDAVDTLVARVDGIRYMADTGDLTLDAYPPLGRRVLTAFGDGMVAIGYNDEGVFELLGFDGTPGEVVRTPLRRRRIESEERSRAERDYVEDGDPQFKVDGQSFGLGSGLKVIVSSAPKAEMAPLIDKALFDELGMLWMRRAETQPDHAPRTWEVHSPSNGLQATVVIPSGLTVLEIGDSYVLGLEKDEWGVETVVMYGLHRQAGS